MFVQSEDSRPHKEFAKSFWRVFLRAQPSMSNLTIKQERFSQKYVELGNASEAYRQSYDAENMAPETVHNEASVLLRNHEVSARISVLEDLARKRHEITVDRIFAEYSKLGFQDIRKAFNEDGSMKPIHELDNDTAAAIAGFEVEEAYMGSGEDRRLIARIKKVKLSERRGALDSMAKCMGMFVDRVEHSGKDGKPIEISDAKSALLRGVVPDPSADGADKAD